MQARSTAKTIIFLIAAGLVFWGGVFYFNTYFPHGGSLNIKELGIRLPFKNIVGWSYTSQNLPSGEPTATIRYNGWSYYMRRSLDPIPSDGFELEAKKVGNAYYTVYAFACPCPPEGVRDQITSAFNKATPGNQNLPYPLAIPELNISLYVDPVLRGVPYLVSVNAFGANIARGQPEVAMATFYIPDPNNPKIDRCTLGQIFSSRTQINSMPLATGMRFGRYLDMYVAFNPGKSSCVTYYQAQAQALQKGFQALQR